MAEPSYDELWERIKSADDIACDGLPKCVYCKAVVEALRGGSIHCPVCGHINALGHSCEDWRLYDAGEVTLEEVGLRWQKRDEERKQD